VARGASYSGGVVHLYLNKHDLGGNVGETNTLD
jgi:hypothetical protein